MVLPVVRFYDSTNNCKYCSTNYLGITCEAGETEGNSIETGNAYAVRESLSLTGLAQFWRKV